MLKDWETSGLFKLTGTSLMIDSFSPCVTITKSAGLFNSSIIAQPYNSNALAWDQNIQINVFGL